MCDLSVKSPGEGSSGLGFWFMATLTRPDGAEIAWRERGEGPPVIVANLGYAPEAMFASLIDELARDHRVLSYDARGTGESSPGGPYEIATDVADLLAVVEDAGAAGSVAVGNGDGANRAVRAGAERPDLIATVVVAGNISLPAETRDSEGLVGSREVLKALVTLLENDYRAGVHAFVSSGNPGLEEDAVHERVELIVAHGSQEVTVGRIRAWIEDDPTEAARALGGRLLLLRHEANPWFAGTKREEGLLPEARYHVIADGPMARPDLTAAVVRELTRSAAR
jgi:pimeloyl-ACP methyl ester carboxylesterase